LLTIMGHHEMAFKVLILSVLLILVVFFASIFEISVSLTRYATGHQEHALELGTGVIESLQKSPFHAAAICLAIQSYQLYISTKFNNSLEMKDDQSYAGVVLKVPQLNKQIRSCHWLVNTTTIFWIAIVSCYSIFTLASVPLESSRLPHIYAVFGVLVAVAFLSILDALQLLLEECCADARQKGTNRISKWRQEGATAAAAVKQNQEAHEQQVLAYAAEDERRRREGALDGIMLASSSSSNVAVPSPAIVDTVDRMKKHMKPVSGLLVE